MSEPTYKPPSVWDDHLSGTLVTQPPHATYPKLSACSNAERLNKAIGTRCPLLLLGLAPGGVCQAADITACAGGLLHHRFTLAP